MQNGNKDIIQIPKKFIWKLAGNGRPTSYQLGVQISWQTIQRSIIMKHY
jgi:hypothetical protein